MGARFRKASRKTPFRAAFAFGIFLFHKTLLGPFLQALGSAGTGCRYPQSCSEFAALSILELGVVKGSLRALYRIGSCNPWMAPNPHLMTAQSKKVS